MGLNAGNGNDGSEFARMLVACPHARADAQANPTVGVGALSTGARADSERTPLRRRPSGRLLADRLSLAGWLVDSALEVRWRVGSWSRRV